MNVNLWGNIGKGKPCTIKQNLEYYKIYNDAYNDIFWQENGLLKYPMI
jgi:hypothetical protein